jgi:hypothetical protein
MNQENQIEYLRKQKNENICGGYAELLTSTYNYLKAQIENTDCGYCNPYDSDICKVVYGNSYHITMIRKYIYKLKALGYISIEGYNVNRKIMLIKPLDF